MHLFRGPAVFGLVVLFAGLLVPAAVADIYRWRDDNGVTHFGDKPPEGARELKKISVGEGNSVRNDNQSSVTRTGTAFGEERTQKAAQKKQSAEQRSVAERRCAAAKEALAEFHTSSFRYAQNDDGSRRTLTDAEDKDYETELSKRVEQYCK